MSARLAGTAGLLAAILLGATAAFADVVPEALRAESLAARHWNRYRVVTARSTFELAALRADSVGIVLQAAPRRPSIVVAPDLPPDSARHVRWSEIERVEASRANAGKGALEGAIVGGIVGLGTTLVIAGSVHDESALGAVGITPLGIVFGALAGAGFFGGGRWTRIYP